MRSNQITDWKHLPNIKMIICRIAPLQMYYITCKIAVLEHKYTTMMNNLLQIFIYINMTSSVVEAYLGNGVQKFFTLLSYFGTLSNRAILLVFILIDWLVLFHLPLTNYGHFGEISNTPLRGVFIAFCLWSFVANWSQIYWKGGQPQVTPLTEKS